jgi:hypothetical protein
MYIAIGICRYHTFGCCVVIATQQPDVPANTGICLSTGTYRYHTSGCSHTTARRIGYTSICDVQLVKVAPDDGLTESETCRASNGK